MIYADANGSLPLIPEVRAYLKERIPSPLYGNPNAIHSLGAKIKMGMEKCRTIAAKALGAKPHQLIWNSGSSEGLSTLFHHILLPPQAQKKLIFTSTIEHAAVGSALDYYRERWGYEIKRVPVDQEGKIDFASLERGLRESQAGTALVTIMAVNNETGVIQPWEKIRDLTGELKIPFICDTTQLIGRMPFHFETSGLDWALASGHKLGALPGTGFLLAREPRLLTPLIWGGGQEQGLRGGTQNYVGAETLAIALEALEKKLTRIPQHLAWREEFEKSLPANVVVIGQKHERLPCTILVGCPGIHGQAVQIELESQEIFVTTSSACSDNDPATSKVLKAMGVSDDVGRSVVRVSLSLSSEWSDYEKILESLNKAYQKLSRVKAY